MPDFRARELVKLGRAQIVDGKVRFHADDSHPGYNTAPDIVRWAGRKSGAYGPTVLQALRHKFEL